MLVNINITNWESCAGASAPAQSAGAASSPPSAASPLPDAPVAPRSAFPSTFHISTSSYPAGPILNTSATMSSFSILCSASVLASSRTSLPLMSLKV